MNAERVIPVAVIGSGHLGSRHIQRLHEAPGFRVVAVHDRDAEKTRAAAEPVGAAAAATVAQALDLAEAVVVATSTGSHREVAGAALEAGLPVLVEKPLTGNVAEARELVSLAAEHAVPLHVGHVERFNPALRGLLPSLPAPLFVESHRLAPLVPRNLDINVVQDLMVHDLDLAIAFVGEEPVSVDAVGVAVLTGQVDIANARLRFPGGAVANLTASRVSLERVRKFRMFLPRTYVSADCAERKGRVFRLKDGADGALRDAVASGGPLEMLKVLDTDIEGPEGEDALTAEHDAFRRDILGLPHEGVTGETALKTLRAMVAVEDSIREGLRAT